MQMLNGLPQGNKIPTVFTHTLGTLLQPLWERLSTEGIGAVVGDICIPFLVFSDNIYPMAMTEQRYIAVVQGVRDALKGGGWNLPWSRAETPVINAQVEDPRVVASTRKRFKAVGIQLAATGRTHREIKSRCDSIKAVVPANYALFRTKGSTPMERIALFLHTMETKALW